MTPERWGAERQGEILGTLRDFAAIPSVSTDPAYAGDMRRGADFLAEHMRACGLENVVVRPTAGHPVVMADWLHAQGAPTILIYGHYDVQPPEPLAKWHTPPFEPTLRDGRLYGRGVSDDKGPVIVALSALAAFLKTSGRLPVNVKLLIEGEEEIGSAHLDDFVARTCNGTRRRLRALGRWRDLARGPADDRGGEPRHLRDGTDSHGGRKGSAFRASWRVGREPAAGVEPLARQPARRDGRCRRLGILRQRAPADGG